jgi:hypothetical protein
MEPDPLAEALYEGFIERVRATGVVWGLRMEPGEWAYSDSDEYEDVEVVLFWSEESRAAAHQLDEWEVHEPTPVPLEEFLEHWLRGMQESGALVGPDWNEDFIGLEVDPAELASRLLEEADEEEDEEE